MEPYKKHVLETDRKGGISTLSPGSAEGNVEICLSTYLKIGFDGPGNVVRQFLLRNWTTRFRKIPCCDLLTVFASYAEHRGNRWTYRSWLNIARAVPRELIK